MDLAKLVETLSHTYEPNDAVRQAAEVLLRQVRCALFLSLLRALR